MDGWIYFTAMRVGREKGSVQLIQPNFMSESAILFRLSSFKEESCIAKAMLSSWTLNWISSFKANFTTVSSITVCEISQNNLNQPSLISQETS